MKWRVGVLLGLLAMGVHAEQRGSVGLGIIVGEPTGLSFKTWLSGRAALDAAAAWSLDDSELTLHADYLVTDFTGFKVRQGRLGWYYGLGGRFKSVDNDHADDNDDEDEDRLGIRFPFGLTYLFQTQPLEVFGEVVPIMDLVPETELEMNLGIGIRYYIN
jgi:hypothetical protein